MDIPRNIQLKRSSLSVVRVLSVSINSSTMSKMVKRVIRFRVLGCMRRIQPTEAPRWHDHGDFRSNTAIWAVPKSLKCKMKIKAKDRSIKRNECKN
jgi:hypothetical protein